MKKSHSNSESSEVEEKNTSDKEPQMENEEVGDDYAVEDEVFVTEEEDDVDCTRGAGGHLVVEDPVPIPVEEKLAEERGKQSSPESITNAAENALYQEIPMISRKSNSPPDSVDDYAEPSHSSSITSSAASSSGGAAGAAIGMPISTNGSPLYAQVHKEPRTEIQKIHSTIPNTFKNENNLTCVLTTFGTKTPSMTSFGGGNNNNNSSSSGSCGGGNSRHQLLAASYSNDLNKSKDSMLGSLDMLSDSGNHSDSWMYPQGNRETAVVGLGGRKKPVRGTTPSTFTDQLNMVLADRERCVNK